MVRCVLSIRLDAAEFHQSGAITGEVVVSIVEPEHCNGLAITCAWFTRGACPHEKHSLRQIRLFQGPWSPGEHRYRFAASVPSGPLSYDNETVSIAWCVDARAELAWSRDASASAEFRLCPRPDVRSEDAYSFGLPRPVASGAPGTASSAFPTWGPRVAWWALFAKLVSVAPTLLFAAPVAIAAPFVIARFRRQTPGIFESKQLSIPAHGPCTFIGLDSEIVWIVQARMKHSGTKEWSASEVLEVRPGRPSGGVYRRSST